MAAGTVTLVDPDTGESYTLKIADRMYRTSRTPSSSRHTVTYKVNYMERLTIQRLLLGSVHYVSVAAFQEGYLTRNLPHLSQEVPWLRCMQCEMEPRVPKPSRLATDPLTFPHFRYAYLHCVYEMPKPRYFMLVDTDAAVIGDDGFPDESRMARYVSRSFKSKNRVLHGAGGVWIFEGTVPPKIFTEKNFISVTDTQIVYTWHQVPKLYVPRTRILGLLNKTNSVTFDGYAPETLIFSDFEEEDCDLTTGEAGVNLHYTIDIPAHGPYAVPNPHNGGAFHNLIARDGSGRRPYLSADFRWAFKPVDDPTFVIP